MGKKSCVKKCPLKRIILKEYTFIKHCKLHSISFKYITPQAINNHSNPTVDHSLTPHE